MVASEITALLERVSARVDQLRHNRDVEGGPSHGPSKTSVAILVSCSATRRAIATGRKKPRTRRRADPAGRHGRPLRPVEFVQQIGPATSHRPGPRPRPVEVPTWRMVPAASMGARP